MLVVAISAATLLAGCASSVPDTGATSLSTLPVESSATSAPPTELSTPTPIATPTPTPTGPTELTIAEAGERYLTFSCLSNAALATYIRVRDKFDAYTTSDAAPHPRTKKAAKRAAEAHTEAAQGLSDPSYVWPDSVRNKVSTVATAIFEDAAVYNSIAEARTWSEAYSLPTGRKSSRAASAVRLTLGLPPRGECPEEYQP